VRSLLPLCCLLTAALAGCAGPRFDEAALHADAEFTRRSQLARAAYDKGALAQAEVLYRQAHQRARERDAAADIGEAAYNLAVVFITRDQPDQARPLLEEAERELARAGQPPVDVWLVRARLETDAKRTAEAAYWLDETDRHRALTDYQRVASALLRGQLACAAGDAVRAGEQLDLARARKVSDAMLRAGMERLTGRIASLERRHADAAMAFDRETELCRSAGQSRAMAIALIRAGEAWEAASHPREAAERLYRAARSLLAQGAAATATPLLQRATRLAAGTGDTSLQQSLRQLAVEAAATPR
jgi:tetratricopeptide (TPR) repeat protein